MLRGVGVAAELRGVARSVEECGGAGRILARRRMAVSRGEAFVSRIVGGIGAARRAGAGWPGEVFGGL